MWWVWLFSPLGNGSAEKRFRCVMRDGRNVYSSYRGWRRAAVAERLRAWASERSIPAMLE